MFLSDFALVIALLKCRVLQICNVNRGIKLHLDFFSWYITDNETIVTFQMRMCVLLDNN